MNYSNRSFHLAVVSTLCIFAAILAGCAKPPSPAPAEPAAPAAPQTVDEQVDLIFQTYDTNHDGKIDENEALKATVDSFEIEDTNHDGEIDASEIRIDWKNLPEGADQNHDCELNLKEAMEMEKRLFQQRDANHDGVLSREEVRAALIAAQNAANQVPKKP